MRKVHDRLRCEPASESHTEYETINSLVEALSSVSDSLRGSSRSSFSSSSSVPSLSLNFTVPVPHHQCSFPAANAQANTAAPRVGVGASDKLRPLRPLRQHPKAISSKTAVSPAVRQQTARPVPQSRPSVRKYNNAAARRDPLSTSSKATRAGSCSTAEPSQLWKVATGQSRTSLLREMQVAQHHKFLAVPSTRFSACSSTSQQLVQTMLPMQPQFLNMARRAPTIPLAVAHSQPLPPIPQPAAGQQKLAAIKTSDAHSAGLSVAQLNELAEIMDEIIKRMGASMHGAASEMSMGGTGSAPLPHAVPSPAETQELSSLLIEAEQVMLALRQVPNVYDSSPSSALGAPMRSMLHKVQSWVDYSQLSSLNTSSNSQAPLSPMSYRSPTSSPRQAVSVSPELSHRSLAVSPRHTIVTSDSDMDFIPALALPMQSDGALRSIGHRAQTLLGCNQQAPAGTVEVAAVTTGDSPVGPAPLPPSSQRSASEVPVGVPAGRHAYAAKPGSSTDTLPGPPATPFSAASDSDAVGPSTPSNSFAQGSVGTRPASLPAAQIRAILPVQEGAGSDVHISTTLDTHDTLSAGTVAWVELPDSENRHVSKGVAEGEPGAAAVQPRRAWWNKPFHVCFGSSTGHRAGARHRGGTPRQVRHKINAAKGNKQRSMSVSCSCL